MKTLETGTRIYYGGDMSNNDGFGTIRRAYTDKWGRFYDIDMDDGRKINGLPKTAFSETYLGHGGTRFVTVDAYNDYRRKLIEKSPFNIKYQPAI